MSVVFYRFTTKIQNEVRTQKTEGRNSHEALDCDILFHKVYITRGPKPGL